ncbi:cytochrome P450 [Alisedimentitalea sp. MJ-SS2]|uniref:cytochrome P450 n=1 Tax=Aliisedimentitalea sp. MJ-SS2 TaxID=3049795 RepID=UPI002906ACF5|nr:cytochrome P450 [Alisedimentitalea sp. MJ-SS2]MDU8926705.1 cytochrome P450 [Alisedimentitalea sp. MJ-SS2]
MQSLAQSPTDPDFVQNPYPFYDRARAGGDLFFWQDYDLICATSHEAVHALLRDRRMGRECPPELTMPIPEHLAPFYALEANSMLEAEPPRHTRLRRLVTRSFTSARIVALAPQIRTLVRELIDAFPDEPFDLIPAFASRIPVTVICRLLGVPEQMADQFLAWSHDMVGMYQAGRTRAMEDAAAQAADEFASFIRAHIESRRSDPKCDLLSHLIAAEEEGDQLTTDELVSTCILLLNAGHEATVHSIGNAVKTLLEHDTRKITPDTVEECLRFDPPLHMFIRYAYEDFSAFGHDFKRGDRVGLLLAAAGRDPSTWSEPNRFDATREAVPHHAFGGGIHFCVGAPLARLEITLALEILFARCPGLQLAEPPSYADSYHFHGLARLMVNR